MRVNIWNIEFNKYLIAENWLTFYKKIPTTDLSSKIKLASVVYRSYSVDEYKQLFKISIKPF